MDILKIVEAVLLGGGVVSAMFKGPKVFRIIAIRFGMVIDLFVGFLVLSILVPAGAAAAAFGTLLSVAIAFIMIVIRYQAQAEFESEWTQKDQIKSIAIIVILGWLPWVLFWWWWIVWIALIVALLFLHPKTQEQIDNIREDPEIFYVHRSAWKQFFTARRKKK